MTAHEQKIHDLVIVGSGPGGLTAGIYARRAAMDTVLVEKGIAGGQMNNTDIVENWPGTQAITGSELAAAMAAHAAAYDLETINREVVEVEPGMDCHRVHLDDGTVLETMAVILATGGAPRQLGVEGENEFYGRGVSYCAVCDGFFFRGKTVVVVGGGDSALEEALYLAKIAKEVHIVHRRDEFRAGKILQKRALATANIEVHWNRVVERVLGDESGVTGVALASTVDEGRETLPCDGVFIFIGFVPNNKVVPAGVRLDANGFVVTDEQCATTVAGIYAVGDLRQKYVKQIVTAAADGCVAAQAAAHYVEQRKNGG